MPTAAAPIPKAQSTVPAPLFDSEAGGFGAADATPPPTGGAVPYTAMAGASAPAADASANVCSTGAGSVTGG
jgi:hypothetical protein